MINTAMRLHRYLPLLVLAVILLLPAEASAQKVQSINIEAIGKRDARVSWIVHPYAPETDSYLHLRKEGNKRFRTIDQRAAREITGGIYRTFLKNLRTATMYQFYITAKEPDQEEFKSAWYTIFTKPEPRLRIEPVGDRAIVDFVLPRKYKGYVRYGTEITTTMEWTEAKRETPGAPRVGVVLAPLAPDTGYQYQIQIRTKDGRILYTMDTVQTFRTPKE